MAIRRDLQKVRQRRMGYHLPLDHPGLAPAQAAGVVALGCDDWPPHRQWGRQARAASHHCYMIIAGEIFFAALQRSVGPHQVVVIPDGYARRRQAGRQAVQALFVDLAVLPRYRALTGLGPVVRPTDCGELCLTLANRLRRETLQPTAGPCTSQLSQLLLQYLLAAAMPRDGHAPRELMLNELWQDVYHQPQQDWSTPALAAYLHCSVGHVHRLCRDSCQQTPQQMVTQLRLAHAEHLLISSERDLAAIAEAVGFATASAFSDAFLRRTGMRPGRWRRR